MRLRLQRFARALAVPATAALAACGHKPAPRPGAEGTQPNPEVATPSPPTRDRPGRSFLIAHVRRGRALALRKRPGGHIVARLGDTTEFGDRTALTVLDRRGPWLGVAAPELPQPKLGWFRRSGRTVRLSRTRTWLQVDLGRRRMALKHGDRVSRRVPVGIGAPGTPTPTGTFAVTDKLPGSRFNPAYGRFILALSGRQPRTPRGWTGGDRLAIHGTDAPRRVGERTSAGCLITTNGAIADLVRQVPAGAPVVIEK